MLPDFRLIIPIFFPSWRFFHDIAPSPRIEFRLLKSPEANNPQSWQDFRPLKKRQSILESIKSIFFNPEWNETQYIVNCAESLIINPKQEHASDEIALRISIGLIKNENLNTKEYPYLEFRVNFLDKEMNSKLRKYQLYQSKIYNLSGDLPE